MLAFMLEQTFERHDGIAVDAADYPAKISFQR
jgi:hypothetical protein